MDKRRFNRQEKAKEDKKQYIFANGQLIQNVSKLAVVEPAKIDFNKRVTCPFCLSWLELSKFVISTKKGYHQGLGRCPECGQQSKLRTLFGLGKSKPKDYAKFITDYPKAAFWKKCKFADWKKRLAVMNWTKEFWDSYKKLNPKSDESTKEEDQRWNDYFNEPEKAKPIISKEVKRIEKFTAMECHGCQFKAGSYCWGQCTINVWKKRSDW